jgi:hypothetical protein
LEGAATLKQNGQSNCAEERNEGGTRQTRNKKRKENKKRNEKHVAKNQSSKQQGEK